MANRMILNETSYFGADAISEIVTEAKKRAFKKALVVTVVRDGADRISFVALNSLSFIPLCALEVTCCVSAVAGDKRVRPPPLCPDRTFSSLFLGTKPSLPSLH